MVESCTQVWDVKHAMYIFMKLQEGNEIYLVKEELDGRASEELMQSSNYLGN